MQPTGATGIMVSAWRVNTQVGDVSPGETKLPHIALFAIFCLLTALQFEQLSQRALRGSLLATIALGLLVELEEGASRTGNCRLTDVLPDIAGALIASIGILGVTMVWDRMSRTRTLGE